MLSSAASAIAGNTFLRSITAAGFPLFARQLFTGLGIQWASTLLGCVALLLVPIPIAFWRYGSKLREKGRFSPTMADKPPLYDDEDDSTTENKGGGGLDEMRTRTIDGLAGDAEKRD